MRGESVGRYGWVLTLQYVEPYSDQVLLRQRPSSPCTYLSGTKPLRSTRAKYLREGSSSPRSLLRDLRDLGSGGGSWAMRKGQRKSGGEDSG